jgi:hypothetical protein
MGYKVDIVSNGADAVAVWETGRYQAILMQDQHIGVAAQRDDAVRIHVDGRNHAQDIAQRAESTLHIRSHRVDLAVYERFDVELLRRDDDGVHGLRWGRRRAVRRLHDLARYDDKGKPTEPYPKGRRTDKAVHAESLRVINFDHVSRTVYTAQLSVNQERHAELTRQI